MTIKQHILETATSWRKMGRPNLFEEFLVRNGTERLNFERTSPLGKKQQCFSNSLTTALLNRELRYCEGYAWRKGLCIPIHHAWLVDPATGLVWETTWGKANKKFAKVVGAGDVNEYLGYEFPDTEEVWKKVQEAGYYGLFANGMGFYNHKLMLEIDPGLANIPGLECLKAA